MESLCGSGITSGWIEASVAHLPGRLSRVGAPTLRLGLHGDRGKSASLMLWSPPPSPQKWGRRWRVLAHEASGGCGENNGVPTNGFNVLINDGRAFPEVFCDDGLDDCSFVSVACEVAFSAIFPSQIQLKSLIRYSKSVIENLISIEPDNYCA